MIEVAGIADRFREGMAAGWRVIDAGSLRQDTDVECDVVIIGSGAGGGTSAEILSAAGLSVVIVEEGPLRTSNDFSMDERSAYRELYQEGAARSSDDGAIMILQGRSVGGSTTVNWTSSFRTPAATLTTWADVFGVRGVSATEMAPWFERMEQRLDIQPWPLPPNANNASLALGCERLGLQHGVMRRNVRGCWNLGYCGMGCPTNAKQSMLVTTLPAALGHGARLYHHARAWRLLTQGDRVSGVACVGMHADHQRPTGVALRIHARHTVLAGGGINSPALLLRSQVPDPYRNIGRRTFLHLVDASRADFDSVIDAGHGAPQSVYSDHFVWQDGAAGAMGYKLEVMPLHPGLTASLLGESGDDLHVSMQRYRSMSMMIALMRDGFHEQSLGGRVELREDGTPTLHYPLTDYVRDGLRRGLLSMAEIQFAAGAKEVRPLHRDASVCTSWAQARGMIAGLAMEKLRLRLGAAHIMGGCAMGEDEQRCVTDSEGQVRHLRQISVIDGSLFPTSIGANPQLSIYALAAKLASGLAQRLRA